MRFFSLNPLPLVLRRVLLSAFFLASALLVSVSYFAFSVLQANSQLAPVQVWNSCVYIRLSRVFQMRDTFFRPEKCSHLVRAAVERARAGSERFLELQRWKGVKQEGLDGCLAASPAALNTTYNHWPKLSDLNITSWARCQIEWVVYSNDCGENLNRLADLCDMAGIRLAILGLGEWWRGFGGRTRAVREYVQSLPPDRIVISTDASDVFLLASSRSCRHWGLLRSFLQAGTPVLFGAERYCFPDYQVTRPLYPAPPPPLPGRSQTPYRFLNAGSFMGYAWAVADVLQTAHKGDCMDDQRELTWLFLNRTSFLGLPVIQGQRRIEAYAADSSNGSFQGQQYVSLDYYNLVFQLLGGSRIEDFDLSKLMESGEVVDKSTGGSACIFHQEGDKSGSELVMPKLLKQAQIDWLRRLRGYVPG